MHRARAPFEADGRTLPRGLLRGTDAAAGERLRQVAPRAPALSRPARVAGRPAAAALRRDRAHPAAAPRGGGGRRGHAFRRRPRARRGGRASCPGRVEGAGPRLRPRPQERRPRGPRPAAARRASRCAGRSRPSRTPAARSRRGRCSCRPRPGPCLAPARRRARASWRRLVARRPRGPRACAPRAWASTSRGSPRWTRAGRASCSRSRWASPTRPSTTPTSAQGGCASASTRSCCPTSPPPHILERPRAGHDARRVHGRPRQAGGRGAARRSWRRAGPWWPSTPPRASRSTQLALPVKNALAGDAPPDFFCPGAILKSAGRRRPSPLGHGLPETLPVWFESPAFDAAGGTVVAALRGRGPAALGLAPRRALG